MRPQHITAENAASIPFVASRTAGFNEAAAYHCGKLGAPSSFFPPVVRFNEAAAYHCGKPEIPSRVMAGPWSASMRPQHITAENERRMRGAAPPSCAASMRPQHITAENRSPGQRPPGWRRRFNEAAAYHCGKRPDHRPTRERP